MRKIISAATASIATNNIRRYQNFACEISIILVVMCRQLLSGYGGFGLRTGVDDDKAGGDYGSNCQGNGVAKNCLGNEDDVGNSLNTLGEALTSNGAAKTTTTIS